MSVEAAIVIENNKITDSFFNFLDNKQAEKSSFASLLSLKEVEEISKLADLLATYSKYNLKLEILSINNMVVIRVKKATPFVVYKIFPLNTNFEKILKFANKKIYNKKQQITLKSGKYNLIIGRFAEKFIHEWISHPIENNHTVPPDFNATAGANISQLSNIEYKGKYNEPIPENWLYIRYVNKGSYNSNKKKINIYVKEAFLKNNGLIQSISPFNCSFDLEQLNKSFCKVVSNKDNYKTGFFCTKGEKTVFGTVKSGFVLFKNIPITLKGEVNE